MHWMIAGNLASLTVSQWTWNFDLSNPSAGMLLQSPTQSTWSLLAIHPVPKHACYIDDHFVRGSDLMVRYGQSESDQFAFQIDLRKVPQAELGSAVCGFDVWLSVQTQLLDSHPTLEIDQPSSVGQWRGDTSIQTCNQHGEAAAIFIHPSDLLQTELIDAAAGKLRLFGNFMEKGVIRRGRVRCLVGSQELTAEQLQAAYDCFAESPLPLTT